MRPWLVYEPFWKAPQSSGRPSKLSNPKNRARLSDLLGEIFDRVTFPHPEFQIGERSVSDAVAGQVPQLFALDEVRDVPDFRKVVLDDAERQHALKELRVDRGQIVLDGVADHLLSTLPCRADAVCKANE